MKTSDQITTRTKRAFCSAVLVFISLLLAGCTRSENPVVGGKDGLQSVSMSAAFSKEGATALGKVSGLMSTDSLEIDSAIVVFQRIKFEAHVDSVVIDTTEGHESEEEDDDANITFKGPFVVHVRDTMTIDFASQLLPAGTYDGVKFKIHRIGWGERYEDSDDFNHRPRTINDTSFVGWGIVVWGRVQKDGAWIPFTYHFGGEVEFKLKGDFVVPSTTSSVNVVLNFDMASWFRDWRTGALLDPTDGSIRNRELINWAIRHSFQNGHGGHDNDRDGHPDDE